MVWDLGEKEERRGKLVKRQKEKRKTKVQNLSVGTLNVGTMHDRESIRELAYMMGRMTVGARD